ncbi:hypothetical protein D3C86_2201030 [compost metagenome]
MGVFAVRVIWRREIARLFRLGRRIRLGFGFRLGAWGGLHLVLYHLLVNPRIERCHQG